MYLRCKILRPCVIALCLAIALSSVSSASAAADAYPKQAVKVIVPYSAGGSVDLMARVVSPELSKILGVPFVVENVPGASGSIAMNRLAVAKPDGYTLAFTPEGACATPPNFSNVGYGTKEFAPIAQVAHLYNTLFVSKDSGIKTLKELIEKAEKEPLSVGITGAHTSQRIMMELLMGEIKPGSMTIVPFHGATEVMAALLGGKISAGGTLQVDPVPYHKNGSITVLAIAAPQREGALADVPTFTEQGYPTVLSGSWYGYAAPAKTPPAIIAKLEAAVAQATKQPHIQEAIKKLGVDVRYLNTKEFTAKWHKSFADVKAIVAKFKLR